MYRGADVNLKYNGGNLKDEYNGRTALDLAKEKNHTEIVELLRQHGATE